MSESPADLNPEAPASKVDPEFPDLRDWGGIERVRREVKRSATIMANRENIAWQLLAMGGTSIRDIVDWDEAGVMTFVASKKLKPEHVGMVKSVEQRLDKEGRVVGLKVTLYDKVAVLRLLAQCAGLLRKDADDDKPAVVGVRVRGPKRRAVTYEEKENG